MIARRLALSFALALLGLAACSSTEPSSDASVSLDASAQDASLAPDAAPPPPDAGTCKKAGESCAEGRCCKGPCVSTGASEDGGFVSRTFCPE